MGGCRLDASGSVYEPVVITYGHGHECSGSTKCWEFLD
jgi:hypothetical protein